MRHLCTPAPIKHNSASTLCSAWGWGGARGGGIKDEQSPSFSAGASLGVGRGEVLKGNYSVDRSSESSHLHSAPSARSCSQQVNINSFKAHYRQTYEVIVLPPSCSREKLPKVIQLVIEESGFEPRVETLGSHVIHSL